MNINTTMGYELDLDKWLGTANKGLDVWDRISGKSTTTTTQPPSSSGLSTNMKIGIGVAAAALGFVVLKSFKKSR
jgi:hypothetical protein